MKIRRASGYTFLLGIGIILIINGMTQKVMGGNSNFFIVLGIYLIIAQVILDILYIVSKWRDNKMFRTKIPMEKGKNIYLDLKPDCPMCKKARSLGFEICPDCNKKL